MWFLVFLFWLATPAQVQHTYRMTWTYDCVHYVPPKYFEFGLYNNGHFTPIGKTTVQSCRGANWQFIVNGSSPLVPATAPSIYYVRGISNLGRYGPATFHP